LNAISTGHPEWWRHAVLYEIYPRSFQDSDGNGIGDLAGITARLSYLKGLGVDAVWVAPFYESPMRDFGYDVSDYCAVDPMFGTLADFDAMVARAHELDLKVLVDLVLSHTSEKHPWFERSRADRENDKADWYVWADAKPDGTPPNNWLSIFGGSAWKWDTRREQYYLHNFLASQPDLNFHCPGVQDAVLDVARFWFERGADGFRLDTVNFYTHDRQLRDNPPQPADLYAGAVHRSNPYSRQQHLYDKTQPENLPFLARLRALADRYPDSVLLGEVADDQQYRTLADYTAGRERLHMAYVFRLLDHECSANHFADVLAEYVHEASQAAVCWSIGNHDVERVVTRWKALGGTPRQRGELAATFLMALPGAKCLYQGEELGLGDVDVPFEQLRDPFGIEMWPRVKGRDGCRTPMPWTPLPGGGFSTGTAWLPIADEHLPLAASRQVGDPQSMHSFYVSLMNWHRLEPALRDGALRLLASTEQVLAFERTPPDNPAQTLLCLFNFSDRPAQYGLPAEAGSLALIESRSTGARVEGRYFTLAPLSMLFARRVRVRP
jgi:alpha-glucosidase